MKKLRNKVLGTIFIIFTISILTILIIYQSINYLKEKRNVENNLNNLMVEKNKINLEPPEPFVEKEDMENLDRRENHPRFMDVIMYTVVLENNSIQSIISHTKEDAIPSQISDIAQKIIQTQQTNQTHIGNLYLERYSYRYDVGDKIILIDNYDTNKQLQQSFFVSFFLFGIFEVIAYFVSFKISLWIIRPVENSFQKQKQFIADASHELKTPLAVIMASAEALENDSNVKWLKNIQDESNRMNKLIKSLLDLAKYENEELPLNQNLEDLSKLTEKTILPLESLIYEKKITLDYHIEENIPLKCNSEEIKQLITILMDNAIKHSMKDGKITLNLKREKDQILLEVKNIGEAIPKGEEEKIFERFYRADKSRNRNENRYGLGLSIAKNIVERHQGNIIAFSLDNVTTFIVRFRVNKK